MQTNRTPTYISSSIGDDTSITQQSQLSSMQWQGLQEVQAAETTGREAVIADGVRDSLVELELILPDIDRYHRMTEKAKSLIQQAAADHH